MKNITNELELKLSQEFRIEFPKFAERLTYGGIKIPESVLLKCINFRKKYEAESISDIKNNYNKLTQYHLIPFSLLKWGITFASEFYKRHGEFPEAEEDKLFPLRTKMLPPSIGLNLCSLDSVRIRDTEHIPEKNSPLYYKFNAIRFNVYDRFNEYMPAVFVYKKTLSTPLEDEEGKKQLEKVLNSTPLDTFNIWFLALDKKLQKEALKVISIQRNRAENKENLEVPDESDRISNPNSKLNPFLIRV